MLLSGRGGEESGRLLRRDVLETCECAANRSSGSAARRAEMPIVETVLMQRDDGAAEPVEEGQAVGCGQQCLWDRKVYAKFRGRGCAGERMICW